MLLFVFYLSATCSDTNKCINGASCKRVGNYDFCECLTGTYGDTCDKVTACVGKEFECKFESGANCGYNKVDKRAECICESGQRYDSINGTCRGNI